MLQSIKRAAARAVVTVAIAGLAIVPVTTPLTARAELATYAQPPDASVEGTISRIPGKYEILVRDEDGSLNSVELHEGTIINPTGIALKPGFSVTIYGHPQGDRFVADEIDTPYTYDESSDVNAPYPYYAYPYAALGPPYWYALPPAVIIIRH